MPEEIVLFPEPPDPPRVQFLRSIQQASDVEPSRSGLDTLLFGEDPAESRRLVRPFGCTVHDGVVYVTDTRLALILRIDIKGRELRAIAPKGRAKLRKPMNLCFAPDGTLYVADAGRRQVVVLTPEFGYANAFGPFDGRSKPLDVIVHGQRLYVVDSGSFCVRVLDRGSGKQLLKFGDDEENANEFMRGPTGIAVDKNGYAYVSDTIYGRVYVWDRDGNFVRHIGSDGAGDSVGDFFRPKGLAVADNTLYVLDSAFENCQVLSLNGDPLMFFGGPGIGPGRLYMPATIWIGTEGLELFRDQLADDFEAERLILIISQFGPRKLSFYAFGRSRNFEYPETKLPDVPDRQQLEAPAKAEKARIVVEAEAEKEK
ncbi:MAG: 6-bladed beta-propeller, partial [Planctomycetota bacterium]